MTLPSFRTVYSSAGGEKTGEILATVLIFAFALFVLFYNLGGRYLQDWDEAWYVLMARTAINDGEYLVMKFRNEIFWDKSPLPVLPMIAVFKLFGITEGTARISSSLFAMGILVQIFMIARRFYGHAAAVLSVLVCITAEQFVFWHGLKSADIDSITLFFVTGALTSWVLIERIPLKFLLTAASLSFAFLCKGPVIAIPLAVILASLFIENPITMNSLKYLLTASLVAGFIVIPWYLYMYLQFGQEFIQQHVVRNFLQRYNDDMFRLDRGDTFYLEMLLAPNNFLWYGAALSALFYFFKTFAEGRRLIDFAIISWVFGAFFIVNQSQTKAFWYIYPIYPFLAIMIGRTLADFMLKRNYLNSVVFYATAVTIVTAYFNKKVFPHAFGSNIAKAGLVVLLIYALMKLAERYRPESVKVVSVVLVTGLCYFPAYNGFKNTLHRNLESPIHPLLAFLPDARPINAFDLPPGAIYYLSIKGDVREFYKSSEIRCVRGQFVVTKTEHVERIRGRHPAGTFTATFDGEPYVITIIATSESYSLVRVD